MYYLELTVRALKEKVNTKKRTIKKEEEFYDTWYLYWTDEISRIDVNDPQWSMMCKRLGLDSSKWKVEPYKLISSKKLEDRVMYVGSKKIKV